MSISPGRKRRREFSYPGNLGGFSLIKRRNEENSLLFSRGNRRILPNKKGEMRRILFSSPEGTGEFSSRLLIMGTYADSTEKLSTYHLKYAHGTGVHEDEQITSEVKRTVAGMPRYGVPR